MTEFNFYLSNDDTERLFALKDEAGERELHRLHPERVRYDDETGERVPRK